MMEFSSSDIPDLGCKNKCNDKCQCSSIAQLFGGLWNKSKGGNSVVNSLDNKLASWGCKYSSCCAISSLYSASSFSFKIDELLYSTNVNAIYEALENIAGVEQVNIEPNSTVVLIKGASGILGSALNILLSMGFSVSKIILDDKKSPKTMSMREIEMGEPKKGKKGKKGKGNKRKLDSSEGEAEDHPLLSSVAIGEDQPDLKLHFKVGGMTCASCTMMIQNIVQSSVDGVRGCDVNLLSEEMVVRFPSDLDHSAVSQSIISAVEELGFTVEEIQKQVATKNSISTASLKGMTCSSCVGMIETCLMNTKGVKKASVNLLSNLATITYDETVTGPRDLIESVSELGFGASLRGEHAQTDLKDTLMRKSEIQSWRNKFLVSLAFTLPIVLITMVFMYIPGIKHILHMDVGVPRLPLESVLAAILATPVQFYCGWEFYVKAWKSLKARAANMEVLVSMGSTVAYAYSLFSMIKRHHFFETSAALICFSLLGRFLENIAKGKTSQALVKLMDLKPNTALLVKDHNLPSQREEEIHSDLIQMGDILKVVPGSSIPADGVVVSGFSSVNESMITGESASVFKEVGSQVVGGTINNEGLLFIKAARVGANSTLSKIVQLVEEAQTSKPLIQAFADKITGYFVPIVVAIAVATWLVWFLLGLAGAYPAEWRNGSDEFLFALMFGISVLVISCPCALGLATPTAIMVGTGVGAELGLLIKGGQPLEMAQKVNTFLFDKTGTLTVGNLQVTDFIVVNGNAEELEKSSTLSPEQKEFLYCLGSAESASEHPIGKAIFKFCKESLNAQLPSPTHFITTAGRGLSCQVDSKKVTVGNRAFIQECIRESQGETKSFSTSLMASVDKLEEQGKTCVFIALEGVAAGIVGLSDVLKPEARAVIQFLRNQGNEIYMVTGDNRKVAHHVGRQLGLDSEHIISEVVPREKGERVKMLQSQGKMVAFVGDGINDSVALSQAHLGIALGSGTDVAMECADIVVMGTGLQGVGTAVDLARTTYKRMRLNMLWALMYNSLAIPLAAGLFFPITHSSLPPMFAGFAMAISSVSVVVSSLMLRLYKPKDLGVQNQNKH